MDRKIADVTREFAESLRSAHSSTTELTEGVKSLKGDKDTLAGRLFNAEEDIKKVWLEFKRLVWLYDQISQPQGTTRIDIFLAGVDLGTIFNNLNIIAGSGISITSALDTNNRWVDLTISAVGAGGTAVFNEVVSGSNTTFTLANTPVVGTQAIYGNGQRLSPGTGGDYTISGAIITIINGAYSAGAILADYEY